MKGNYRIRLHFVGGGKMQVAYAAPFARDAAFDALFADLSAGEKKWLTFGGALINRLKLTHVEKFEKTAKGERT